MALSDIFDSNYRRLNKMIKTNDISGIVRFLSNNTNIDDKYADLIMEKYDITIDTFVSLFDQNGNIKYDSNNRKVMYNIIFNSKVKELMVKLDPNWKEKVSDIQKEYIEFSLKNPIYDKIITSFGIEEIDDDLKRCFNGQY